MTDRIDIHKPLFAILAKLGLEPEDVSSLEITPRSVTATLYRRNERGVGDIDYQVATETKTFDVTTHKIEAPIAIITPLTSPITESWADRVRALFR